jgi:hypothetical protein
VIIARPIRLSCLHTGKGKRTASSLAQKKGFVTAVVCYINARKSNDCFAYFHRGFVPSMRVGLFARFLIADSHPVEGCCRHGALGSDADRGPQEGPGSLGVRRLTERLKVTAALPQAAAPRETPTLGAGSRCPAPHAHAGIGRFPHCPSRPRLISTALSCPAALCAYSSRASSPRLRLAARPGCQVCMMAGAASRHDGTAWTNRSARAMMPAVRHEVMLPPRLSASSLWWRPSAARQRLSHPFIGGEE